MSSALNQKAPEFEARCYHNGQIKDMNIKDFEDYYKVLFFYPLNFTFICPTEIHELLAKQSEFEKHIVRYLQLILTLYIHMKHGLINLNLLVD